MAECLSAKPYHKHVGSHPTLSGGFDRGGMAHPECLPVGWMHTLWNISAPEQMSLYAIEVARRQPDGTWRWLIGDPFTVGRQLSSNLDQHRARWRTAIVSRSPEDDYCRLFHRRSFGQALRRCSFQHAYTEKGVHERVRETPHGRPQQTGTDSSDVGGRLIKVESPLAACSGP